MMIPKQFRSGITLLLASSFHFCLLAQLEIQGGNPGIKVSNANIAGQFDGVEIGIRATNSIVGSAIEGQDNSTSASSRGVKGFSSFGVGVFGQSNQGTGVYGISDSFRGLWGDSNSSYGVYGTSDTGVGGYFRSTSIAAQLKGHLKLESLANNHSWQFEINSGDGYLLLYYNDILRGSFNSTNGNYASVSDRRLKRNITPLNHGALEDINKMRPVSYVFENQVGDEKTYGLIAQELKEIMPDIVQEIDLQNESTLAISYSELIPVLIKGMQEQQLIINELKKSVINLQKNIDKFRENSPKIEPLK